MKKTEENNMILAEKIMRLRKSCGMSQDEFGDKIGVTRQAVSRWEVGLSLPSIGNIITISKEFEIPIDVLLKEDVEGFTDIKKNKKISLKDYADFLLMSFGIIGCISIPFLAKNQQITEMKVFKTAYENYINYIFEFPLILLCLLSILVIITGIWIFCKKRI